MNKEIFTKGFWRMTCQRFHDPKAMPDGMFESIHIENRSSEGGVEYEFQISWYNYPSGQAARLEIFDDAFTGIKDNDVFFGVLSQIKNPSPDEVHRLLLNLGYEDFSDKKHYPSGNGEMDTYICYVQNYLGIMYGEDVVSNMGVFVNQEDIDSWLTEQLAEAKETGFEPEDDPSMYLGMNDYELHMSKGNEREGFVNYGLVCRPYRMKM